MDITNILSLLGGLALFLYGMQMMSCGLEAAAGNKMKQILERLTANRFLGVVVGALITAVIQSSSATTVMVVGFVNSGMMTLQQAVWIIMGANIGTTITGQLIALDVGMMAPLFAFFGVSMVVFLKNPKAHHYGEIIAGLGVLFIGMGMMSDAMKAEHNNYCGATNNNKEEWVYSYGEHPQYVLFGDWQICFQTYADLYNLEHRCHVHRGNTISPDASCRVHRVR